MVESGGHSHLERLLDDAQAYLDAGEVDRAITVLGEAYKIDRRHLRVSCLLGFCALQKGKLDDAKKYFSFVVRMELDNASARLGLKRLADHTATPPALAALQLAIPKKIELKEDVSQISVSLGTRLHIYFGCAANGVILGTIFVLVAVWAGQDLFGQILDTRAARFWLIVGPVIGGFIGLLFAPRTIRKYREQTAAKGKNTGALREGVKVPMHSQDVTSREPSTVTLIIVRILWLPSLILGACLGGVIADKIFGGVGGVLGFIFGIATVQSIYSVLSPSRRR